MAKLEPNEKYSARLRNKAAVGASNKIMQTLNLDETENIDETADKPTVKNGFWRRQFRAETTSAQKKFDWTFGVILPVICFAFDPVVFKGNALGPAAFGGVYKPFAYLLSFTSIMAMMAWLIWGDRLKSFVSILGGLFLLGSAISFIVGVMLFPLSLLGLIIIGALGFTPLLTGIVYLRNGVRALRSAKAYFPGHTLIYPSVLVVIFGFTIPFVINVEIDRSIQKIKFGDENVAAAEARKLRLLSPLVNFDVLANECFTEGLHEPRSPKNQIIASLYADMTGQRIEDRRRGLD